MKKKSTFIFIILLINCLCFPQQQTFYNDLIKEKISTTKSYQKNFNPLKYDGAILKSCFIEMVDILRKHYYSTVPLQNLPMLDSVALIQAEFQAISDKLTTINIAPLQYTSQRLKKYNFTVQGDEFVSKAKSQQGDNDYSYYDLCLELLKPLTKNAKGVPAFLSPQYTIFGFSCAVDRNMRSVYISLILGNDLTIQLFNSAGSKQKDLPISKGTAGLLFYEEAICKKCAEDNTLEQLHDFIYWDENGDVFLECDDLIKFKKIISKSGDAFVLDFIQKEQYSCRVPQIDHNKPFRGIVSKPISVEKILAANDSTAKSNYFHAKICAIPPPIELSKSIDINILILQDKKYVCKTLIKKNVKEIQTNDLKIDSLISAQNYEEALYKLAPLLADSLIAEPVLFTIIQLAAHKEKTYLSSIFTQSVQMAALRNPIRLCKLLHTFSVSVFDNVEVRKIYCSTCK